MAPVGPRKPPERARPGGAKSALIPGKNSKQADASRANSAKPQGSVSFQQRQDEGHISAQPPASTPPLPSSDLRVTLALRGPKQKQMMDASQSPTQTKAFSTIVGAQKPTVRMDSFLSILTVAIQLIIS